MFSARLWACLGTWIAVDYALKPKWITCVNACAYGAKCTSGPVEAAPADEGGGKIRRVYRSRVVEPLERTQAVLGRLRVPQRFFAGKQLGSVSDRLGPLVG